MSDSRPETGSLTHAARNSGRHVLLIVIRRKHQVVDAQHENLLSQRTPKMADRKRFTVM